MEIAEAKVQEPAEEHGGPIKNLNWITDRQWFFANRLGLSLAAVQKLNVWFGATVVSAALSSAHVAKQDGREIRSPFAYVKAVCEAES